MSFGYAERPQTGTISIPASLRQVREDCRDLLQDHLPGHSEPDTKRAFQHLEKRYFEPGDLGFNVWRALGGILAWRSAMTGVGRNLSRDGSAGRRDGADRLQHALDQFREE
jgi:hypothetical protein